MSIDDEAHLLAQVMREYPKRTYFSPNKPSGFYCGADMEDCEVCAYTNYCGEQNPAVAARVKELYPELAI